MRTYRIYKGTYYFPSYESARAFAEAQGHPTDRIIRYEMGWAIQLRVSGPYVGRLTDLDTHYCIDPDNCQSTHTAH